jgi:hypothetical protein
MARTLLQLCQEFSKRLAIPVPQAVTQATDAQTLQMWGLLNEGQMDLGDRANTQILVQQARQNGTPPGVQTPNFPHAGYGYANLIAGVLQEVNTASGGSSNSVATPMPGFKSIVQDTFWETTFRLPVYGPLTEHE